ncbi:MAG TPA: GNAT family N-acetyltransferase [Flexivirga sp.]|uniref:GNAT family N-acetyltransferase n=1 Tax=Flexivirga sp. TaxID=1962927 RepID=UPI002CC1A204|nr:GNAT family N-acetyltransferase [Flexivirga sp.]HWC24569.1 GNAT family N-acetyltransferase [Flexivirga sp.]
MADGGQWRVRTVTDPAEARESAHALVAANPVAYSVFSTVTDSLIREPGRYADPLWFVVSDGDGLPALVSMQTAPHPLHLPESVPGAVTALAEHLLAAGADLDGVNGPQEAALEFADGYLPAVSKQISGREGMGVYDLPVPVELPWPVSGEHRMADASHLPLVSGWVSAFMEEIGDSAIDAEATARRQIAAGNVSLWTVHDRPVAMCWASAAFGGVVRVSGVYTPRAERGHGYASAVVHSASRQQQEQGHTCMLYTELANPTSNKIYRALGYRHLGNDLRLKFSARR